MARPEEKAQNMLNKWVKMRQEADRASMYGGGEDQYSQPLSKRKRPYLASECDYLQDAEKFRRDIIREIGEHIRKIQNAGMGEHAIRDLNDHINKLLREKFHWNKRIKELKGPDYNALERRQAREAAAVVQDATSSTTTAEDEYSAVVTTGYGGYRYFGAARDLPGVKELFERNAEKVMKRKRGDMYKYITPDYYGLRDEEDGVLVALEERAMSNYDTTTSTKNNRDEEEEEEGENDNEPQGKSTLSIGGITSARFAMEEHVAIPSQELISRAILQHKKRELLSRLTI
jgi:pre-mRNA-splicing factor ISY1